MVFICPIQKSPIKKQNTSSYIILKQIRTQLSFSGKVILWIFSRWFVPVWPDLVNGSPSSDRKWWSFYIGSSFPIGVFSAGNLWRRDRGLYLVKKRNTNWIGEKNREIVEKSFLLWKLSFSFLLLHKRLNGNLLYILAISDCIFGKTC